MVWKNGYIPDSDLVVFQRGHNSTDGDWYWALTPGTLAKLNALIARAQKRTGRTLRPSDGYSCYRPIPAQQTARRLCGNGAAVVGTSSHGGWWEGRETLAIDIGNWAWVYENHGGRAAFYEDARAVGLTPGMISRERGYPDEPWHLIDLNPRAAAPASQSATPIIATQPVPEEEDVNESLFRIVIDKSWYLCIPKPGGGFHAVAQTASPDRYASAANARIPVIDYTGASSGQLAELAKAITGLPRG